MFFTSYIHAHSCYCRLSVAKKFPALFPKVSNTECTTPLKNSSRLLTFKSIFLGFNLGVWCLTQIVFKLVYYGSVRSAGH